eukprot:4547619-Lingulodinium_polyedra.AAC.1
MYSGVAYKVTSEVLEDHVVHDYLIAVARQQDVVVRRAHATTRGRARGEDLVERQERREL